MVYLLVALGGGLGSVTRYTVARVAVDLWGDAWPLGTLVVNVLGSFLLGLVIEACIGRGVGGVDLRLPLGTGFMGGFTTYSSFSVETVQLLRRGETATALAYAGGMVVLCFVAAAIGVVAGRAVRG